jgi:hypothetical protein
LGDLSHIGRFLQWAIVLKNSEEAQILSLLFLTVKVMY